MINNYGEWLRLELYKRKITQLKVGEFIGKTDRTVRNKIKNNTFTEEEKDIINLKLKQCKKN